MAHILIQACNTEKQIQLIEITVVVNFERKVLKTNEKHCFAKLKTITHELDAVVRKYFDGIEYSECYLTDINGIFENDK